MKGLLPMERNLINKAERQKSPIFAQDLERQDLRLPLLRSFRRFAAKRSVVLYPTWLQPRFGTTHANMERNKFQTQTFCYGYKSQLPSDIIVFRKKIKKELQEIQIRISLEQTEAARFCS